MPAYPGISSDAFRHPLDREAEQALRSVPGFDLVARKFVEFMYERPQTVYLMGNHIQVGPRQYATLYHILRECVQSLDLSPEPTLFVCQNPVVNSYALGEERACVVVNSGLLDLMDEAELRSVIAHELDGDVGDERDRDAGRSDDGPRESGGQQSAVRVL